MKLSIRSALAAAAMMMPAAALAANGIAMHRDPGCGCCEKWAAQVRQQFGRNVQIIDDAHRDVLQRKTGVDPVLGANSTVYRNPIAQAVEQAKKDHKNATPSQPPAQPKNWNELPRFGAPPRHP